MSKTKRKSHNETRHKDGIIREQAKLIKQLQQRLRQYEKYEQNRPDNLLDEPDIEEEIVVKRSCKECGKGKYDELDLGVRIIGTCNVCGHRETK